MIKLGVIMDSIASINIKKDTTFAILLEAQRRNWNLYYMEINDLYLSSGQAKARTRHLYVQENENNWYNFINEQDLELQNLDVILMRKDPPVNAEYIYATYILEYAELKGVLVLNKPKSLRDCNEKLFAASFEKLIPDTLVTCNFVDIRNFCRKHKEIILKPLDGMGGKSVFHVNQEDLNLSVIIETLTKHGKRLCIAQNFISNIKEGDKRIFIVDGKPVPYCLARIPIQGEIRGNLSAGGHGEARYLSDDDWKIAYAIAPELKKRGLFFVGLDIIGDQLIEINITSPTCVREIEQAFPISITGMLINAIEKLLKLK
ncbi:Glutathione synthetase [Candidatus Ecksteinia adelgidicola]|nr:Glutathione synthetase [Candidatus Ecksteinia adelgidicola]